MIVIILQGLERRVLGVGLGGVVSDGPGGRPLIRLGILCIEKTIWRKDNIY